MQIVKSSVDYEANGKFLAWSMMIARNRCMSHLRSKHENWEELDEAHLELNDASTSRETLVEEIAGREDIEALKRQIDLLPTAQRSALVLWMSTDCSYEELASQLMVSVAATKSLLFRAKRTLAQALGPS